MNGHARTIIGDVANEWGKKESPGELKDADAVKRHRAFMPDRYNAAIREALEKLAEEKLITIWP